MSRETFVQLFDYCRWANHRVWDCIMALSDEQFYKPLEYSIGSIQRQSFHAMQVEHWWPHFLRTGELDFYPYTPETDRETIRALWDQVEAKNIAYVAQLDDTELARLVRPDDDWEEKPNLERDQRHRSPLSSPLSQYRSSFADSGDAA